jgi:hydroxyacylglutathione hydrolase
MCVKVYPLRVLETNYTYVIPCEGGCVVVDPGEFAPVDAYLKKNNLPVVATLLTHKHWDHVGGVRQLVAECPHPVYGFEGEDFDVEVSGLSHGEIIQIAGLEIECIHLPGHTMGACGFLLSGCLFTGDVLFGAGCGRIFEGNPRDMMLSMDRIAALDDNTRIYCGHEYTAANLRFAKLVEPDNDRIKSRIKSLAEISVPSTLGLEKDTNPFLRVDEKQVIDKIQQRLKERSDDRVTRLGALREWKNQFDQDGV